jgi:ABC-type lipoprotein release transport system permease subunit
MLTVAELGLRALLLHRRLVGLMAVTVAVSLAAFLVLRGYQNGLSARYANLSAAYLLVEQSGSLGEFYGSRIPANTGALLLAQGASLAVPEIHSVVGVSPQDAVLLRGISLERYAELETFRMVSGRPLQPGDPPRLAMIGVRLAAERGLAPGGSIQIRGRDFQVAGVFEIGTYADYEAWITLADAQKLMGWGEDVSVFVIPGGEKLQAGAELPGGLSVVRKGESGTNLVNEWQPLFDLLGLVSYALGVAAAVTLANVLGRLVWLHRRDLAILLSLGFGRAALSGYLLIQGAAIGLLGLLSGCAAALALSAATRIQTAGISIQAVFDGATFAWSLVFTLILTLAGSILPVFWFAKTNLAALLRADT